MPIHRRVFTGHHWRLRLTIGVAILAGTLAGRANGQTFVLYDPAISSSPQTVASAPLSDLLVSGSYIQADGAEFSNFSFSAAAFGGALEPEAAEIEITAPTSAIPELEFQGGPFIALNTEFVDASLKFDVTELESNQKLTTAELAYTGGTFGTGTTSITEDIDDMNNNLLGQKAYVEQQGFSGSANAGTIAFAPEQEIQVSKDIMLYGAATGDSATLSDFTQSFDASTPAVPEPSSIAMAMFGCSAVGWFGWRRRAKRRRANGAAPGNAPSCDDSATVDISSGDISDGGISGGRARAPIGNGLLRASFALSGLKPALA